MAGLLVLSAVLGALPQAQAAASVAVGAGGGVDCRDYAITSIVAVVAAGDIVVCLRLLPQVDSNTATFFVSGSVAAPGSISGTTTFTWTVANVNGCTKGTEIITSFSSAATAGSSDNIPFTMTSNHCRATVEVVVKAGATPTTIVDDVRSFDTIVPFVNQDNQNRLCAASALGASCTTPTINDAVTGTLDTQSRVCAASSFGAECTTPAYTVTFPDGLSVSVSSWPALQAILSGTVLPCSTAALAADVHACDMNTVASFKGNQTNIVTFPQNLTVDMRSTGGLGTASGVPGFSFWIELMFWVAVFAFCWWFNAWLVMTFALIGVWHLFNPHWQFGLAYSVPWMGFAAFVEIIIGRMRYKRKLREESGELGD